MNKIIVTLLTLSSLALNAQGRDPNCDRVGGQVVFIDMLYGLSIGAVFSGLILVASEDKDRVGRKIATGSLLGATAGMGLGMYELVQRRCQYSQVKNTWSQPKLVYLKGQVGLSLSYNF